MDREITKEEEGEVRNLYAHGIDDEKININRFMEMIDHLSHSDSTHMQRKLQRKLIIQQKLLLLDISEQVDPRNRSLLGLKELLLERNRNRVRHENENENESKREIKCEAFAPVDHDEDFDSIYKPHQMRCLALVSQIGMKGEMRKFVSSNKNLLKKFRLVGNEVAVDAIQSEYIGDDDFIYGPGASDDMLSNYAKLTELMNNGRIGGVIIFEDPRVSAYTSAGTQQQHDEDDLGRLCFDAFAKNVMIVRNPVTALMATNTMRTALRDGKGEHIPSFFLPVRHPSVPKSRKALKMKKTDEDLSDVINLKKKLAKAEEENIKLTRDLKSVEMKADQNYKELTSIVEGIMDVENKDVSNILQKLRCRFQVSSRGSSPLTVTEEVSNQVTIEENNGSSRSSNIDGVSYAETTAESSGLLSGLDQGNGAAERRRNRLVEQDAGVSEFVSVVEGNEVDVNPEDDYDTDTSEGADEVHDNFDTESVVYDFARPVTPGSRSLGSRLSMNLHASRSILSRRRMLHPIDNMYHSPAIDNVYHSPSIDNMYHSPASSIHVEDDYSQSSELRLTSPNSTHHSILSIDTSGSVFSAFSRRDKAMENLKKRFQSFANSSRIEN